MKLLQKLVYVLHLHVSWVRVMLTFSVLAVIAVLTFPQQQKEQLVYKPMIERVAKYQSIEKSDSTIMFSKSLNNDDTVARPAPPPIEVKIISDKKFDWKGTAAWGIGLINGVILLILNLKKLFNKTA